MTLDRDGKIRMDCSSPYAMAGLIDLKGRFDIAFGNDPDSDRHGIVTRGAGLLNPNAYLSVAVSYLFKNRPAWRKNAAIGKTLVSTSMIDRVAADLGRRVAELPVGFKWFVEGLIDGSYGFGGEESAGASFLREDGEVWTTDKDGIVMNLLAAEIMARTGRDPAEEYRGLEEKFGQSYYLRLDIPALAPQREVLKKLSPEKVPAGSLAGEPIRAVMTRAPENGASIGGIKVSAANGWFAARPSGTEDIYKIYAESFIVGYHFITYLDDPAESKALDSAGGANKGMLDLEGRPHTPLLNLARAVNHKVMECLAPAIAAAGSLVTARGPMPCLINRIAGHHRQQIVLYSPKVAALQSILASGREQGVLAAGDRVAVDVDPVSLL